MQAVSIYDELVLRRRSERGVTRRHAPFLPLDAMESGLSRRRGLF